ncbi:hypothetical protein GAYE_SCF22MG4196 [Galdieria yellowstonensis]|jgi:cofilin|uniref:ADF-H domain-containing protein n=1 Tax=Galdieria yellowstonensis TaxID=3028027 RepID=A0AAV9IFW0_9RHOD|nr:hypothetical protein GAYE_SCF22MG4196 [Galdieria yellowstonensis]
MASGVAVDDTCGKEFTVLVRSTPRKYRAIIFKLTDDLSSVCVEKTLPAANITKCSAQEDWKKFVTELPQNDCRFAVYDFEYQTSEGVSKNRIIFILWSPESAKIKSKMLYSSSREALVQKLNGVQKEIQATDQDEIEFHNVYQQVVASATHK